MRKLLAVFLAGGIVWWFLRQRDRNEDRATIGYADGSSVTLDAGSPELDRLLQIAAEAATA